MLGTPVRNSIKACLVTTLLGGAAIFFSSCATETPRTALIDDPDAQKESSIPWNKPAKWETGAQVPGGIGGLSGNSINN